MKSDYIGGCNLQVNWSSSFQFKTKKRGYLKKGFYADIVVFNPKTINDFATFENLCNTLQGSIMFWLMVPML